MSNLYNSLISSFDYERGRPEKIFSAASILGRGTPLLYSMPNDLESFFLPFCKCETLIKGTHFSFYRLIFLISLENFLISDHLLTFFSEVMFSSAIITHRYWGQVHPKEPNPSFRIYLYLLFLTKRVELQSLISSFSISTIFILHLFHAFLFKLFISQAHPSKMG